MGHQLNGRLTAAEVTAETSTATTVEAGCHAVSACEPIGDRRDDRGHQRCRCADHAGAAQQDETGACPRTNDEIVRWDVTYVSDGVARGETVVATSGQQITKFTELTPIAFEIDGSFGGCRHPYVYLDRGDQNLARAEGNDLHYVSTTTAVALESGPLTLRAYCVDQSINNLPIPSFSASVVFHATRLGSAATRQFG